MGDLFDFLMMRARQENVVIAGAEHRPPSFLKIPEKMTALMDDYKQFSQCHTVESAARLHVHFVGIHPFVDGNGRTSRLLMNFELLRRGYLPVIIPVLERATLKRYLEVILGE